MVVTQSGQAVSLYASQICSGRSPTDLFRPFLGYSAYDKLSPAFRHFLDGKKAIYRSAHTYLDRENPSTGPKYIEREHPLVRVHPATGWKTLWVNRAMTVRIVGLEAAESGP